MDVGLLTMLGPKFVYAVMLRGIRLPFETKEQVQIIAKTYFKVAVNF